MTQEEKDKIIEILKFHGSMIGVDSEECAQLVSKMNLIHYSYKVESIEEEIFVEMNRLCEGIGYEVSKKNNKSREGMRVPMRDVVVKRTVEQFPYYPRLPHVVGEFFNKDRSTGHSMISRGISMDKKKDAWVMREYNKTCELLESE